MLRISPFLALIATLALPAAAQPPADPVGPAVRAAAQKAMARIPREQCPRIVLAVRDVDGGILVMCGDGLYFKAEQRPGAAAQVHELYGINSPLAPAEVGQDTQLAQSALKASRAEKACGSVRDVERAHDGLLTARCASGARFAIIRALAGGVMAARLDPPAATPAPVIPDVDAVGSLPFGSSIGAPAEHALSEPASGLPPAASPAVPAGTPANPLPPRPASALPDLY